MHGIEIVGVEIITGAGADLLLLETAALPAGEWPFEGAARLSLTVAAGEGAAYAARYFPGVPSGITRTTRPGASPTRLWRERWTAEAGPPWALEDRIHPTSGRLLHASPVLPAPPQPLDAEGEGEVG